MLNPVHCHKYRVIIFFYISFYLNAHKIYIYYYTQYILYLILCTFYNCDSAITYTGTNSYQIRVLHSGAGSISALSFSSTHIYTSLYFSQHHISRMLSPIVLCLVHVHLYFLLWEILE